MTTATQPFPSVGAPGFGPSVPVKPEVGDSPRFGLPPTPVRLWSPEEFDRMVEAGILTADDRVELLEGWIVPKMPPNPPHAVIVSLLVPLLDRLLPPGWHVRSQVPSRTSDSRPEPDASIVAGRPRDYLKRHPGPAETALVIEVSDSTLDEDRGRKRRIYSRAGIPVYWIVNLVDGRVEVHTDPTGPVAEPAEPAYGSVREIGPDDSVPLVLGGRPVAEIPARDLLP